MTKAESISGTLHTADEWQRKGELSWVSHCLSSALMDFLSVAVSDYGNPAEGIAWLGSQGVVGVLRRQVLTLQALVREVEGKQLPSSIIGGNYHPLVFAHMAWCLQENELATELVEFASRQDVRESSTKFWCEYAKAVGALSHRERYHVNELPLRGLEKYWTVYLKLIQRLCDDLPIDDLVSEIDEMFRKRNMDKKIQDDAYEIEGSARHPVRWDFRKVSLLMARKA